MADREPLLVLEDVTRRYTPKRSGLAKVRRDPVRAVDGVQLTIAAGETVGLVGESGCGKSTLARLMVGLEHPSEGRVLFDGEDVAEMNRGARKSFHRAVQLIFQDPHASLDPRKTVAASIAEGIVAHELIPRAQHHARVHQLLRQVGLDPSHAERYPHEFSGGQLQRIGIARALAVEPKVLICDEPVSALDISVRAQVLNLLNQLKHDLGLAIVFIAHDLDVVQHMSDRIMTMYLGKIVEEGTCDDVYATSGHPYTRALLSAVPKALPEGHAIDRVVLEGDPPSPSNPPPGCPFHTRCYRSVDACADTVPALATVSGTHRAACLFAAEVSQSHIGMPYQVR